MKSPPKKAEAIRAELHYRQIPSTKEETATQLASAKSSYQQAIAKAGSSPALLAKAKFGLGLCEEELGNFDQAQQIYKQVSDSNEFAGTVSAKAAAFRLVDMNNYRTKAAFKPAPIVDVNQLPSSLKKPEPNAPTLKGFGMDSNKSRQIASPNKPSVAP